MGYWAEDDKESKKVERFITFPTVGERCHLDVDGVPLTTSTVQEVLIEANKISVRTRNRWYIYEPNVED